jgi:flagellar hook-associated protein 2
MRQAIYEPGTGLPAAMSSLADIGISTGAPTGTGTPSQSALEGQLKLNTAELESAIQANPTGVEEMLLSWSKGFQQVVNVEAAPGGTLDTRIEGDSTQVTELGSRITTMNEMLAVRQKTLQAEFLAMETVVSQNQAQSSWLTAQLATMLGTSSSSSSKSSG